MIEVFRSKIMVLFMMLVIGVIFVDCSFNNSLESNEVSENLIVANS